MGNPSYWASVPVKEDLTPHGLRRIDCAVRRHFSGASDGRSEMIKKNYWANRSVPRGNALGSLLKRSRITQWLTNIIFSVRASDEVFLSGVLRQRNVRSVLDVACGGGKAVIPSVADYVVGVDIDGFPAHQALSKGYTECVEYRPPAYAFIISREVDAVTAVNLNAHVSQSAYRTILCQALSFLRPSGIVILIHEYDNDGISYRWMRRNRRKFRRLVEGMEHWYLRYESEFLNSVQNDFPGLRLVRRQALTCGILPALHYYVYWREKDPGPFGAKALLGLDVPLSIMNFLQTWAASDVDRCFLVGYVFEKQA
jgi:SAM-dependent methyltransferase